MHNFHNIAIWKEGINLVDIIYSITESFPKHELFGLASQMQRAAVSVPSNIAEGSGKTTDKEFSHFLNHSIASFFELETQLIIAHRRQYINNEQFKYIQNRIVILQKQIVVFKGRLELPPYSA